VENLQIQITDKNTAAEHKGLHFKPLPALPKLSFQALHPYLYHFTHLFSLAASLGCLSNSFTFSNF